MDGMGYVACIEKTNIYAQQYFNGLVLGGSHPWMVRLISV
jgi:hypothetical protein